MKSCCDKHWVRCLLFHFRFLHFSRIEPLIVSFSEELEKASVTIIKSFKLFCKRMFFRHQPNVDYSDQMIRPFLYRYIDMYVVCTYKGYQHKTKCIQKGHPLVKYMSKYCHLIYGESIFPWENKRILCCADSPYMCMLHIYIRRAWSSDQNNIM